MNKKSFNAKEWLQNSNSGKNAVPFSTQGGNALDAQSLEQVFKPSDFLSRGWKGEGLVSKPIVKIQKVIEKLYGDSLQQFKTFSTRNRSLKYSIYEEFLLYLNQFHIEGCSFENYAEFWEEVNNKKSEHRKWIQPFIEIYSFRAVVVYLFKVQFLNNLLDAIEQPLQVGQISNPSNFINKIFKKGSSLEIDCESLQTNLYSWYRPNQALSKEILELVVQIENLQLEDVFKATDISTFCKSYNTLPVVEKKSHSLSQNSYGCFINDLVIKLPVWLKKDQFTPHKLENKRSVPKVVKTKFTGNFLDSLCRSHWFAQMNRISHKWNDLICPDFINNDFLNGKYMKICQELHFMCFVISLCRTHGLETLSTLSQIMKDKYSRSRGGQYSQMSFFQNADPSSDKKFDRIVLNITSLPKKNPHHYLLTQISQQNENLNHEGILIVFSNQKLFVPSQSEKIEQLLKKMKIEANFSFEGLKGRGEIPSYLYVFTKKQTTVNSNHFSSSLNLFYNNPKESCLTFRWNGELTTFNKFDLFIEELNQFFEKKSSSSASLYQSDISEELTFQFHQDAILEGKLLSATNGNEEQITHPSFFKNLTKSCVPLQHFFHIDTIDNNKSKNSAPGLLGINYNVEQKYPVILVLNHTNPKDIQIEIIPSDSYQAKRQKFGTAFFHYFGLIPKLNGLDLNIFREFFESSIGRQIIQLCLNGSFTKIKSKLSQLLIPKFFTNTTKAEIPEDLISILDKESFLRNDFETLKTKLDELLTFSTEHYNTHPSFILSLLTEVKNNAHQVIESLSSAEGESLFNNSLVIEALINLDKLPIFPNHPDVFVDNKITNYSEMEKLVTGLNLSSVDDEYKLEVFSYDESLVELHGPKLTLDFIKFIMNNSALNKPIGQVFYHLEIPQINNMEALIEKFKQLEEMLKDSKKQIDQVLGSIITNNISFNSAN